MSKLFKTKTFWGGIVAIVSGVGMIAMGDVVTGGQTVVGGFIAIFVRDAIRTETLPGGRE